MSAANYFTTIETAIGTLLITGDGDSITGLYTPLHPRFKSARSGVRRPQLFLRAEQQLRQYFAGERKHFELPLQPEGTEFQHSVWRALETIPFGKTCSYAGIGAQISKPLASRAVGSANARNPIMILIPCHRVIAASGALSGYAGGESVKRWLLQHESNCL